MLLSEKLTVWLEAYEKVKRLEAEIKAEVMLLKKTQVVGRARATFSEGRGSYDHKAAVQRLKDTGEVSEETIKKHTDSPDPVTDYRGILADHKPDKEFLKNFFTPGNPSVSLKIDKPKN